MVILVNYATWFYNWHFSKWIRINDFYYEINFRNVMVTLSFDHEPNIPQAIKTRTCLSYIFDKGQYHHYFSILC